MPNLFLQIRMNSTKIYLFFYLKSFLLNLILKSASALRTKSREKYRRKIWILQLPLKRIFRRNGKEEKSPPIFCFGFVDLIWNKRKMNLKLIFLLSKYFYEKNILKYRICNTSLRQFFVIYLSRKAEGNGPMTPWQPKIFFKY